MINKKQVIVIGSVVILMGLLLSMDIKGLVKPKDAGNEGQHASVASAQATEAVSAITIESISALAKESLNANLTQQITELENSLKSAPPGQKLAAQKQLAQKWDDVNQPAPGALYAELIARQENTYPNWIKTGDLFTSAYQNIQDSLLQPALVQKAIDAYQKALAIQPDSRDAKTGLGVAYVSGTQNPMQGIQLLLGVVKEDPQNVKANMNLGLFSMRSGQFDKAVNRFKTVINQKPDAETWFYLASSYENLGRKDEAVTAYQKSKDLAADPGLSQFVDKKIQELKK